MKKNYLNEWTPEQFKTVKSAIVKFIKSRMWETNHSEGADPFIKSGSRNYTDIDKIIGLAYTSSGDFAGLWACNTNLYLDNEKNYYLNGFALDKNSFVHAIFQDSEEKELSFPIN